MTAKPPRKPYKTDVTDAQGAALEPLLPPAKHGGRPREVDLREVVNTLFYQARTGVQWDLLPAVTAANLDDGTHAPRVLRKLERSKYPRLEVLYADHKYRNKTLDKWLAKTEAPYRVEVSCKGPDEKGFVPIRIRWRVEQGIACLNRCRRLSKDYEYTTASSEAWVQIAAIQRMVRRLRPDPTNQQPDFKYPKKHREAA